MLFKTYHNDLFTSYMHNRESLKEATIKPAALVDCTDIHDVFEKTNSIDHPWTQNPEVREVLTDRPRSLSVGDLVKEVESGKVFICESSGWKELPREEFKALNVQ